MTHSRSLTLLYTILATLTVTSAAGCTEPSPNTATTQQHTSITEYYGPATLSAGNHNNWSDTTCPQYSSYCRLVGDASGSTITGVAQFDGNPLVELTFYNDGLYPITFANNSPNSDVSNRMHLHAGADLVVAAGYGVRFATIEDWTTDPYTPLGWVEIGTHAVDSATASTPSRTLGTAFKPSADRMTMVTYSASADCTITLSGGQEGRVELLSDSANPPTTIRADVIGCKNTGTVVVGVTQVVGTRGTASYIVPVNDYVLVRKVDVTGTPSYAITRQTEQRL